MADVARRTKQVARLGRNALALARNAPFAKPGHFYSPLSTPTEAEQAIAWRNIDVVGIDLRESEQLQLCAELSHLWTQMPITRRYSPRNDQYPQSDAMVLHAMIRHLQPRRIIEVGSGWSTAVMLDAELDTELTCIEPYPDRLLGRLEASDHDRITLVRKPVQDVEFDRFAELGRNDVLLIDSTHVLKPGSDVAWEFLHLLPRLKPGVVVHVHDIFWPFEYPELWLRQRRDWTELYLLRAMMTGSSMWQVEFFTSWLWAVHADRVPADRRSDGPGSIWLRKIE